MADITLTATSRNSLLSLTNTASLMSRTTGRLTSGLKVANAIDDAVSYFKAKGLTDRAADFSGRKDEIDQGISSIKAAVNGTTLVSSILKQMKGIINSVRTADSTTRTALSSQFNDLTKQINATMNDASYQGLNLVNNSSASLTVYFNQGTSATLNVKAQNLNVSKLITTITTGVGQAGYNAAANMLLAAGGGTTGGTYTKVQADAIKAAQTADAVASAVGLDAYNTSLYSTTTPTAAQLAATQTPANIHTAAGLGAAASLAWATAQQTNAANDVTAATAANSPGALADATARKSGWDAVFAGATAAVAAIGADSGNTLNYTDSAKIQTAATNSFVNNAVGAPATASITGFSNLTSSTSISPATVLDHISAMLDKAVSSVQAQSALMSGNVTFLQSRMDFTTNYISTLQEGSGKLTLADLNEEGANLVSLQTRQQIGIQSLSIAGQQQQAILSLLR